jgi:hypothetical protein
MPTFPATESLSRQGTQIALASAMHFPMLYYASGYPSNAFLEPKLVSFEDKATQLSQEGFVVIFQCFRQFLYNLQGHSSNPTELKGTVMDEEEVLGRLEGNCKKMTTRDFSIFRLALSYIFGDVETMESMMVRLEPYPFYDLPRRILTKQKVSKLN